MDLQDALKKANLPTYPSVQLADKNAASAKLMKDKELVNHFMNIGK